MLVSSGLIVNQVLTISRGLNYSFGPYTVCFHTPAFHLHASHSPAPPRLTRPHTSMPYTPLHLHTSHSPTLPRLTLPHTSVPHTPPHLHASHTPTPPPAILRCYWVSRIVVWTWCRPPSTPWGTWCRWWASRRSWAPAVSSCSQTPNHG